jgi:hypothetical protein
MARALMIVGLLALLLFGLAAAGTALMFWALDMTTVDEVVNIRIDGERWALSDLSAGHWALGVLGVLIATLVTLVVVPLAVVLGLAGTAFGLAMGLLAVLLAAVVVFSPLIVIGGVLWLALRQRPGPASPPGSAPPAPPPAG